jgi:formylglycine-generating enzyme required for sulfatase activity
VAGQKDLHDLRLRPDGATSQSVRTERREERVEAPDSPLVTMDGDVMGTPAYMPLEQARGELTQLGPHSDVYAVGAMLYHLLLVKHIRMPYVPKGAQLSARAVHARVLEEAPKSLISYDKTLPAPLVAIVEKAMSREIARRYPDMHALAADLRAYLDGRVVAAYETGTWAETRQWVKRNKPLAASIAAGVLVLLGGIALVLQQSNRANQNAIAAQENAEVAQRNAETAERNAAEAEVAKAAAEQSAREANAEREKTAAANAILLAQAREQKLRGMIQEVARFRAQCRTTDGLDRLGKPAYQWWLDEAARLLNGVAEDSEKGIEWQPGLADVRAKLAELRASDSVLPYTEEDRSRDFESHPERRRLRSLEADIAAKKAEYEPRLAALREVCSERRTWRFSDSQLEWWHEQLTKLEAELLWLSQMNEIAAAAHVTERARSRWSEAIEGIARSPKYAGQRWPSGERLTPQTGLLPLGENPVTGLWEFVHLQTGVEPQLGADGRVLRDAEGRLSLTPETGMVMVLLPGGRVPRADSKDQEQEDWIPNVELSPFFLSKYELTADQWDRVSLRRGMHDTDGKSLTPANDISWDDISAMWSRELGWCGFPSETQWEYGCRAGTATKWWTGNDAKSLVGAANVSHDNKTSTNIQPVNTLRANGFGLHDVHGNVWEWCGDTYSADAVPRVGDGLRDDGVESSVRRVLRGGDGFDSPAIARSADRYGRTPVYSNLGSGLRPSRRITP